MNRPKGRNDLGIYEVVWRIVEQCEKYLDFIESDGFNGDETEDYQNSIFETTIKALYGKSFFDYLNSKL